jgi:hypothetical protein
MIWHAKREGDVGLQWLRGVVRSIVESEMGEISKGAASTSKRRGRGLGRHHPALPTLVALGTDAGRKDASCGPILPSAIC